MQGLQGGQHADHRLSWLQHLPVHLQWVASTCERACTHPTPDISSHRGKAINFDAKGAPPEMVTLTHCIVLSRLRADHQPDTHLWGELCVGRVQPIPKHQGHICRCPRKLTSQLQPRLHG